MKTLVSVGIMVMVAAAGCKQKTAVKDEKTEPPFKTTDTLVMDTWKQFYDSTGTTGCFVLYSPTDNVVKVYNPQRAATRYTPASTFKIFNSLVALETGVLKDENEVIKWDKTKRRIETWNQDLDMKRAFKFSAVWFYQDVARRAGKERLQYWLDTVGYGNGLITPHVDDFWLEDGLKISPYEQVEFLHRLYLNQLPFSPRIMHVVKDVMLVQDVPYTMRAKTGWAMRVENSIGWYVGWVEKDGKPYFFANIIEDLADDNFGANRIDIVLAVLRSEGII